MNDLPASDSASNSAKANRRLHQRRIVVGLCVLAASTLTVYTSLLTTNALHHRRLFAMAANNDVMILFPEHVLPGGVIDESAPRPKSFLSEVTDLALRGGYPEVTGLDARNVVLTGEEWQLLFGFRSIVFLNCSGSNVSCEVLQDICKSGSVKYLSVIECQISGDCINACLASSSIEVLALSGRIAEDVAQSGNLTGLKKLIVFGQHNVSIEIDDSIEVVFED